MSWFGGCASSCRGSTGSSPSLGAHLDGLFLAPLAAARRTAHLPDPDRSSSPKLLGADGNLRQTPRALVLVTDAVTAVGAGDGRDSHGIEHRCGGPRHPPLLHP